MMETTSATVTLTIRHRRECPVSSEFIAAALRDALPDDWWSPDEGAVEVGAAFVLVDIAAGDSRVCPCPTCGETHPPCTSCGAATRCPSDEPGEAFTLCDVCDASMAGGG